MLNTNILSQSATNEQAQELFLTLNFEKFDMLISDTDDKITAVSKKIKNEQNKYTSLQIEGFKEEKETLQKALKEHEENAKACKKVHDKVLYTICSVESEHGMKNDKKAVKALLRIIASADCGLSKYAITETFDSPELFNSMETCHRINATVANNDGNRVQSKELKDAYKNADTEIQKCIKKLFSIEVENEYTKACRIKFNKTDLLALHELYTTGMNNKFEKDEKDETISNFKERQFKRLIATKKNKSGEITRNFSKFCMKLCDLTVAKVAK